MNVDDLVEEFSGGVVTVGAQTQGDGEVVTALPPPECDSIIESNHEGTHVMPARTAGTKETSTMSQEAARCEAPIKPNGGPQPTYGRMEAAPPDLFNARQPTYELKAERPEHRTIIFLAAQGMSITEIAQKTGWTTAMIGYVVKQPWAKELILKEIHDKGGDAVAMTLQREALPSIQKLIDIRDSEETQAETQRKAAVDLLDRIYGKCAQPIIHAQAADLESLTDEELAKIVTQGKRN